MDVCAKVGALFRGNQEFHQVECTVHAKMCFKRYVNENAWLANGLDGSMICHCYVHEKDETKEAPLPSSLSLASDK